MRIPRRVRTRRAHHATLVELPRQRRHRPPTSTLGEHPPHPRRRHRIRRQHLHTSLRSHRRQHPLPRTSHLTLRLYTQQHHQRLMHRAPEFHWATRFRQPNLDAQCVQPIHYLPELITVKRTLVLTDHHGVKVTIRACGSRQQRRSLRTVQPRPPPRHTHIEEPHNDRADAVDQLIRHGALPRTRRLHILKRARRHPAVERKAQARHLRRCRWTAMSRQRGNQFGVRQRGHSQLPRSRPRPSCQRHRDDALSISTQTDQERATPDIRPAHHYGKLTQRCHLIVLQTRPLPDCSRPMSAVSSPAPCEVGAGLCPSPEFSHTATQTRLDVLAWINFPRCPRDASTPRALLPRLPCHD